MTRRPARARILAVGDELLMGAHPDLNSPEIARSLALLGIACTGVCVVRDQEEELAAELSRALGNADLVVVTGGLGPTLDDVTRHAVAAALERPLETSGAALAQVEAWYRGRGSEMPEANKRQALLPRGAVMIPNRVGTAPGFRVETKGCVVFCLPGPPREMRVLLHEHLLPWIRESRETGERPERRFHLYGVPESRFAELVGEWMARDADPRMGCSVKRGVLSVTLQAVETSRDAQRRLELRAEEFRARFAESVFSEDEERIEAVLAAELLERDVSFALAESCTGGLASALLCRVPGVSRIYREGFVTYSNAAKERTLGVSAELLARHGAVSAEVAEAMARGARERSGADLAVSITGIAGPGGDSPEKPVGLVWFGVAGERGAEAFERRFPPVERESIQSFAARGALFLALARLRPGLRV